MPSLTARMEYLKSIYARYHKAIKEKKTQILEEFCQVNKYNRKYAIQLLNGPPRKTKKEVKWHKPFLYSAQAIEIAADIWEYSGYLCGQRLKRIEIVRLGSDLDIRHFCIQASLHLFK